MSEGQTPPFGLLLRRYRKGAGLTQEALAERALLSVFTISALERGANQAPRKDTLSLLADALALDSTERAALEGAGYLQAIEIAQSQQARSLELRAAMSLARLWPWPCRKWTPTA